MKIKAIISDLGGVFLNRGIWKFWYHLEEAFGIPFDISKSSFLKYYKPYFSGKITEIVFWNSFLFEIGLKADLQKMRNILLDFFEPNDGMTELYSKLKLKGFILVLLSDQTKEWWPILNEKFKIESFFDNTVVSAIVGITKPDPNIYKLALEACGMKAEECVFIDDLEQNLEPAGKLGMKTVLFKDSSQLKKELDLIMD